MLVALLTTGEPPKAGEGDRETSAILEQLSCVELLEMPLEELHAESQDEWANKLAALKVRRTLRA